MGPGPLSSSCLGFVLFLYLEWSEDYRKGAEQTLYTNFSFHSNSSMKHLSRFFFKQLLTVACIEGGVFHCHISICDAGGVAGSWPHITWSQRWNYVLPLPRPIPSH